MLTNVTKPAAAAILCLLMVLAGCGSSSGKKNGGETHDLSATLSPKQVVTPNGKPFTVPAALAHATGSFSATLGTDDKLNWQLTFSGLGNPQLVVADVHVGPSKKFGPVLFRLCTSCKSGQTGALQLKEPIAHQLLIGKQWLTLITEKYPNGAIRGQISVN
jgi:hypothetical protein